MLIISFGVYAHCAEAAGFGQSDATASYHLRSRGVDIFSTFEDPGLIVSISSDDAISDDDLDQLTEIRPLKSLSLRNDSVSSEGLIVLLSQLDDLERLTLSGQGVDDAVVGALADKRSLKHISLSGPIRGTTLDELCSSGLQESLETLEIRCEYNGWGRGYEGGLSPEAVASISKLRHLKSLSLVACAIEDLHLDRMGTLPDLESLSLDGNPIKGSGLKHLGKLPKLRDLTLSQCRLRDAEMADFPALPNLELLNVCQNQISDEAIVVLASSGLAKLKTLYAVRVDVTDEGVQHLAGLPSLQHLVLDEAPLSGRGLSALQNVRVLSLADTNLTDRAVIDDLSALRQLKTLNVSGNRLTEASLPGFAELQNLERLYIGRTGLPAEAVQALRQSLPRCEVIDADLSFDILKMNVMAGGWIRK